MFKVCESAVIVFLAMLLSACTNLLVQRAMQKTPAAEVQSTTIAENPRVIAFLGDSLTAGPGLSMKETFPAVIQQKIGGRRLPWIVQNSGVSGDTTTVSYTHLTLPTKA